MADISIFQKKNETTIFKCSITYRTLKKMKRKKEEEEEKGNQTNPFLKHSEKSLDSCEYENYVTRQQ
jgi:hypothetical protein